MNACVFDASGLASDGGGATTSMTSMTSMMSTTSASSEVAPTSEGTSADTVASSGPTTAGASAGTGPSEASTGEPGTSTSGVTGDGTSDSTSGGPAPGMVSVPAAVATCVLLPAGPAPYAGPATCSGNATAQNGTALTGLMMIDTMVKNDGGANRRAEAYLRFDIPGEYAGLTVAAATLTVQVADGPDDVPGGPGGVLVLTEAFDGGTLSVGAPAQVMQLVGDIGDVTASQLVMWSIPTALVVPGQPLFLGLLPTGNDGTMYRGATTDPGPPVLELVLQ